MGIAVIAAFLLGISFVVLAISSGFLADATRRVAGLSEYPSNKDLSTAHHWGTIGSIVGWITIALILVAGILYLVFLGETVTTIWGGIVATLLLLLALIGNILVGVFAAMEAYYINKSGVENNNLSYRNSIIAAVLAIISFVAILIGFFIKIFYKPKTKEQKEVDELKKKLKAEEEMPLPPPPPPSEKDLPSYMHERYGELPDEPDDEF